MKPECPHGISWEDNCPRCNYFATDIRDRQIESLKAELAAVRAKVIEECAALMDRREAQADADGREDYGTAYHRAAILIRSLAEKADG